ncbi:unnamed protein product [Phytophthora fragariaefolia]|uniref:UDP-N-acetylglucosamine transferase subunit ALG13 n=1 Tax=Phytophthora fragariaefolia TaxID=1490495 RepID=A0A9W6YI11_9STRA|nr:unnamed protein product [Phytophthora fragariaefolia]
MQQDVSTIVRHPHSQVASAGFAADECFAKCWHAHGGADGGCKAHAALALASALRLAECYVELDQPREAVQVLGDAHKFVEANGGLAAGSATTGHEDFSRDAGGGLRAQEQMEVLTARALYATKRPEDQQEALALIMHLLPDLQAPTLNWDALLLYAKIAHDRERKREALCMALRVLVAKPNDRAVKKTLVTLLKDSNSMERLQCALPPFNPSAGAAYAFIATILKDFGALAKSIECFQMAQLSDPESASYALNHAHALEACCRYAEAYDVLVSFFRSNRTLSVGSGNGDAVNLLAGSFVEALDKFNAFGGNCGNESGLINNSLGSNLPPQWQIEWVSGREGYAKVTMPSSNDGSSASVVNVAPLTHQTLQTKQASSALSDSEQDLLACFFTIVKILFVNGRLSVLPPLIQMLEPLRLGRELHRTTIRNEQAYYACIAQLLSIEDRLQRNPPLLPSEASTNTIYVCGDSHTLATAWRTIHVQHQSTLLRPALVTGLKHWHLRKESTFYPKINFWRVIENIPIRSRVIFLLGEIDCREGILDAVEKCKYEVSSKMNAEILMMLYPYAACFLCHQTIKEGMEHTIRIFMEALTDVVVKYEFETYIHPVVPVLDETPDLVISHVGAGSIMDGLALKKKLVVVVNTALMDNHQTELAEAMADQKYCLQTFFIFTLS